MATAKNTSAAPALVALTALSVVVHDGVSYGPGTDAGDKLEVTGAQAQALIDVGVAELDAPTPAAAAE
jgi:pectin methylesterase-like acyl-CoA thioesterase